MPDADDALVRLLPRTGQAIGHRVRRTLAVHGLTPTSVAVLQALAAGGPTSHRDLAARLGVVPGTLTPVIDALERAGSATRVRDTVDRRVVRVSVNRVGQDRLTAATTDVARDLVGCLPQPTPEHGVIVRRYLMSVLAALRAPDPDALVDPPCEPGP